MLNNTICSPSLKSKSKVDKPMDIFTNKIEKPMSMDIFSNKRSSLPAVNLTKSYLDQIANPFHMYSTRKYKKKKQSITDYDKAVLEDVQKFKIDK
jgi:hypothetical protein